jgi:hypothetical protein
MLTARFSAFVSLSIISTYPPLPESLLSSLLEVDELLALSRELSDQSKPEILPDSELDDEEVDAAVTSATSSGAAWASRFDEPYVYQNSALKYIAASREQDEN